MAICELMAFLGSFETCISCDVQCGSVVIMMNILTVVSNYICGRFCGDHHNEAKNNQRNLGMVWQRTMWSIMGRKAFVKDK